MQDLGGDAFVLNQLKSTFTFAVNRIPKMGKPLPFVTGLNNPAPSMESLPRTFHFKTALRAVCFNSSSYEYFDRKCSQGQLRQIRNHKHFRDQTTFLPSDMYFYALRAINDQKPRFQPRLTSTDRDHFYIKIYYLFALVRFHGVCQRDECCRLDNLGSNLTNFYEFFEFLRIFRIFANFSNFSN